MTQKLSIQLKALFLLLLFSLNTVGGFACALELDLGLNSSRNESKVAEVKQIHKHKDGTIHRHRSASKNVATDKYGSDVAYHHNHVKVPVKHEVEGKNLAATDQSGCCRDEVLKFQSLDKNLNQTTNNLVDAHVFVALLSTFPRVVLINFIKEVLPKFSTFFYYPPPPDIRIAIHRFQI